MSGYAVTTSNLYGESATLFTPRIVQPKKRIVFYAHGANGNGMQAVDGATQPSISKFCGLMAHAGFVVLSADFGGTQTHGNDTELAAMENAWTWAKASGLCATDKVILTGASMGTLSIHRFAKEHPTWVAGINCWIPFVDPEAARTNDWIALRAYLNTSWGMPAGSYIGGADQTPLPYNAKPLAYASSMAPIPTHMWYSTGDLISTNMAQYLAARGSAAVGHIVSTTLTHGDAAVGAADINATIDFLNSVAV